MIKYSINNLYNKRISMIKAPINSLCPTKEVSRIDNGATSDLCKRIDANLISNKASKLTLLVNVYYHYTGTRGTSSMKVTCSMIKKSNI